MADATFDNRAALALDRALSGAAPSDPAVARLVEVADGFRNSIVAEVPDFRAQRVAFVQAAGDRRKGWSWVRFFGPATVTAIALLVAVMIGRSALPGETFYPVRQALRAVGLAPFSLTEIDGEIDRAKKLLVQAEVLKNRDLQEAREVAFEAVKVLGFTEEILGEVQDQGSSRAAQVKALLRRAHAILLLEEKERGKSGRTQRGGEKDNGSSGDGSKKDPPGNSGAVRNDDQRGDRSGKDKKQEDREDRDDRGRSADKRRDGGGNGGSSSGSGSAKDDSVLGDEDEGDDDVDDGNNGSGNDDKEPKDKEREDDGVTPSPEETVDEVGDGLQDEIRKGQGRLKDRHGKGDDHRDGDDEEDDD